MSGTFRCRTKRFYILLLTLLFIFVSCEKNSTSDDEGEGEADYLNPNKSTSERVDDLLARMTLDEKLGQMTQAGRNYLIEDDDIKDYFLGSLLSGGGSAPADNSPVGWADMYDSYQDHALDTRLGIPMIYGIDAVHGHNNVYGATIFPHNIGLGCTRNADLVEEAAHITAIEVAGTGIDWTFAPCIAVVRDERWGRTYEGFAETTDITMIMAEASVNGYQGNDLSDDETILACAKHFIADGATTGGEDQGNAQISEADLRNIHLPGYESALEAGVGSVMATYNSWNGEKVHGNSYLLDHVLKTELGFGGILVSDWAAINQLPGSFSDQIETSINAGIDMVMVPSDYIGFINTLKTVVNSGDIQMSRIDDAVRRILTIKFQLGLFENPYTNRNLTGMVGSNAHREVARQCVRESLVLLKNENDILPLSKDLTKLHIAGQRADDLGSQCGGWSIWWQGGTGNITIGTSILSAIQNTVSDETELLHSPEGYVASGSDVSIVVIGETPYAEGHGDRDDLRLSSQDVAAIEQIHNAGVPIVCILISGRPMIIDEILPYCDAFIAAWLPGTEGQGVADVLFGDYGFSGRLSHTWPASMDQIPINYGDMDYDPLFNYNFGIQTEGSLD